MPIDPSLGTISTSVRVPQLALVTQQVGFSLDVNIHCLHLCRVETFLFSALDVVLSTIRAVHGTIQCCPFSSMATCMLIRCY